MILRQSYSKRIPQLCTKFLLLEIYALMFEETNGQVIEASDWTSIHLIALNLCGAA